MSQLMIKTPTRATLLMWASVVCAVLAMALALGTHRGGSSVTKHPSEARHGWVRGLFANNETHAGGPGR